MALNTDHIIFRKGAALAFLRAATNPTLQIHELSGSYSALREEFKRAGLGLGTLTKMTKSRSVGGLGRLVISGDVWSFTTSGVSEYEPFVAEARKYL